MATNQLNILFRGIDQASSTMRGITKEADSMASRMTSAGKVMTMGLTLPLVGIGALAVKTAAELDVSMRNIQSITQQTDAEIAALSERLVGMSTDMDLGAFSANEFAQAMYEVESAGFAGAEGEQLLAEGSRTAQAGIADLIPTVNVLTGSLNAYQLGVENTTRFSDIMFVAIKRGKTTMNELASELPKVTSLAAAMGVSFEEVNAAVSTMTKTGASTADVTTELRAIMSEMMSGNEQLTQAAQDLGFANSQAMLQSLGLAGSLQQLEQYAGSAGIQMTDLFNNIRADAGVVRLTGANARVFADDLQAMGEAAGATSEAFEQQAKSFTFQLGKFKEEFRAVLIDLGNIIIPALRVLIVAIKPLLQGFQSLSPEVKTLIVAFAAFAAAMGPVLWLGGNIITTLSGIRKGFMLIRTALPLLQTGISSLASALPLLISPMGLVVLAGVALGAGLYLLIKNWDVVQAAWGKFVNGFKNRGAQFRDSIEKLLNGLGKLVMAGIKFIIDHTILLPITLAKALWEHRDIVMDWARGIFDGIQNFAQKLPSLVQSLFSNAINAIINAVKALATKFIQTIGDFAQGAVDKVKSILGIASPSKVFTEIGAQSAAGYAQGFANTMNANMPKLMSPFQAMQQGLMNFRQGGGRQGGNSVANRNRTFIANAGEIGVSFDNQTIKQFYQSLSDKMKGAFAAASGIVATGGVEEDMERLTRLSEIVGRQLSRQDPLIQQLLGTREQAIKAGQDVSASAIQSILRAFGIASPSKVMAKVGEQVSAGFHEGVENGGGLLPQMNPEAALRPSPGMRPAMATAGNGGGDGGIYINTLNVPPGTSREQIDFILREVGKEAKKRGLTGRSLSRG